MYCRKYVCALALLLTAFFAIPWAQAQNPTSGDLTGTVTDPSGASVPDANVTLTDLNRGNVQQGKTDSAGVYRFSLLPPGPYEVRVEAGGFQVLVRRVQVAVTQVTTADIHLTVGTASETVTVTEITPLIQAENGSVSTTIAENQVQNMPNPGNDLTFVAQIAPGVVMNTAAGFGNFAVNGISATSNLFTVNGMDYNDPYLNLNNSGATNLTLGQNEVQEVTVDQSGYTGQFSTLAGSNINYVTRSGGNEFHGRARYWWNGRTMNANSWFNNNTATPRSFVNANQWGGDVGGPIIKNKLFFYFNTEGLRVIIPTSTNVLLPSPAFQTATLANLAATGQAASVPFYQNMFNLYNNAPGASRATLGIGGNAADTGCNGFTGLGAAPCVSSFRSTNTQLTHEQIFSGRLDTNLGRSDRLFFRIQQDHGVQATVTDPISPLFNLTSDQPEWQGQISETHAWGSGATNNLIISGQWYSAIFNPTNPSAALAAFPTTMTLSGGEFTTLGGLDFITPQGRNVSQAQISDDYSRVVGRHTLKFGAKYRLNYVTDLSYGVFTSGLATVPSLGSFFNGGGFDPAAGAGTTLTQSFPSSPSQRFKFYTVGGYAEDDVKVSNTLTLTVALRFDHQSNPTCARLCYSRLSENFGSDAASNPVLSNPDTPYNQLFVPGQKQALPSLQGQQWQPRISFAWSPGDHKTVLRGGFGIFYDAFPGQIVDLFSSNPPLLQTFNVSGTPGTPLVLDPSAPNSVFAAAAASNAAFNSGFANGASFTTLSSSVPGFSAPGVAIANRRTQIPQYQKWSLEVQRALGTKTSVNLRYVGNHGIHEPVQNPGLNAFDPGIGFADLPAAPPAPGLGVVTGVFSEAVSNYHGLTASVQHRYTSGSVQINYTFSKALDEISNGGFSPFITTQFGSTNTNPIFQQNPSNLRQMYGPADYDVRHYLNGSFVWELPIHYLTFNHGPAAFLKDWQVAGNVFARTGLPYTIVDTGTSGALAAGNYGTGVGQVVFANRIGPGGNCSGPGSDVNSPCFNTASFTASPNGFGNMGRNQLRGPGFFSADFGILKLFHIPHWERASLGVGAQFFNIFNHPNFDNPVADVNSSLFGQIIRTVSSPTTPYGSGLGADASPRIIQLRAQFTF
jgi:hypothetical protein